MYPDVSVLRAGGDEAGTLGGHAYPSVVQMTTLMPEAIPQTSVEIRQTGTRQLVTVIEILSPTNKQGDGRDECLAKRNRLLLSKAHLMEIDLIRRGRRVPMREPTPPSPYFVFLSRADRRPRTDVWPIPLDQPLPSVPVPLMTGDPDVYLDLQQALTSVYESCGLDLAIDYRRPRGPALSRGRRLGSGPPRPAKDIIPDLFMPSPDFDRIDRRRCMTEIPPIGRTAAESSLRPAGLSRRDLLGRLGMGFGMAGLAGVPQDEGRLVLSSARAETATASSPSLNPLAPRSPQFPGRARQVVHLFMNGGPSQVDTFDPAGPGEVSRQAPAELNLRTERKTERCDGLAVFVPPLRAERAGGQRAVRSDRGRPRRRPLRDPLDGRRRAQP
ncbi:MAG: DUF4058 family protein [Isosphaeraceae bacterium]